jgi:hypothetical protein
VKEVKLSDLKQDQNNYNLGSSRGQAMIETSLQRYGAARSIVLDRDGNILCGNHTAEAAASVGLDEKVIVVQTTGDQLVAVQRTDLSIHDPKAKELGLADNRSNEVSLSWDFAALKSDFENPEMDMSPFFTEREVIEFSVESGDAWQEEEEQAVPQNNYSVKVMCVSHEEKLELAQRLESEGYRVTI